MYKRVLVLAIPGEVTLVDFADVLPVVAAAKHPVSVVVSDRESWTDKSGLNKEQ